MVMGRFLRGAGTQSVLSPTSTREPSAARLTVIVLTAPMRLAASVSMSIRGSTCAQQRKHHKHVHATPHPIL
eukprot:1129080-Rhodomonas_salina.1